MSVKTNSISEGLCTFPCSVFPLPHQPSIVPVDLEGHQKGIRPKKELIVPKHIFSTSPSSDAFKGHLHANDTKKRKLLDTGLCLFKAPFLVSSFIIFSVQKGCTEM